MKGIMGECHEREEAGEKYLGTKMQEKCTIQYENKESYKGIKGKRHEYKGPMNSQ